MVDPNDQSIVDAMINSFNNSLQISDRQQELMCLAQDEFGLQQDRDHVFRLVDGIDKIKPILDSTDQSTKRLTIVCNMQNFWVTLIIDYENAITYYTDTRNQKMDESLKQIVTDHVPDGQIANLQLGNAAYALVNARLINKRLDSEQPVAKGLYKDINDSVQIVLQKLNTLLTYMKPLGEATYINGRNANILVYFLETVALQDMKLRNENGVKLNLDRIINKTDTDRVVSIRNYLVHRKLNANTKTFNWIEPVDLNGLLEHSNRKSANIFVLLQTYLTHIKQKLHDEFIEGPDNLKTPSMLFKKQFDIGTAIDKDECEKRVTSFVRTAMSEAYDKKRLKSNNAREQIFEFIINVVPYMKLQKNNILKILGTERNDQIHVFYQYVNNESELAFAFRHYMRQNRKNLYAFCLSKIVGDLLSKSGNTFDHIIQVKTDVDTVKEALTSSSCQLFKIGNGSDIGDISYNVADKVTELLNLLFFTDNESAVQDRIRNQQKAVRVKGRHIDLTADDRENLISFIKYLQEQYAILISNHNENSEEFKSNWHNNLKIKYEKEFRNNYGIMGGHLKLLFLYIEQKLQIIDTVYWYNQIGQILIENVQALVDFKTINNMNIKDVIILYKDKNNSTLSNGVVLKHDKVNLSLYDRETKIIHIQTICITRLTSVILEMLFNDDVFKNIQDAFNDENFLDYLEINNLQQPVFLNDYPDFVVPYMGRLLNKSYTNFQTFNVLYPKDSTLQERREKVLRKLMEPNFKHHLYGFMCKDFPLYWRIATSIILKKNNANSRKQLEALVEVTKKWINKNQKHNKEMYIDFLNIQEDLNLELYNDLAYALNELRKLIDENQREKNQRRHTITQA